MSNFPSEIASLAGCPVAVFGAGVSGQAVMDLLRRLETDFVCYDERTGEDAVHDFSVHEAQNHRLIIYSPGFAPDHRWLEAGREAGCVCLTEIDFASFFWKGKTVAVTGTNGKTTLTEFLAYAYKRQGMDAVAVGNNGYPLSRLCNRPETDDLIAVCEVSSFQAEALRHIKFDALIWTNFSEDHLDRYASLGGYFEAKRNLLERLSQPVFIAGSSVVESAEALRASLPDFAILPADDKSEYWDIPHESAFAVRPQQENLNLARLFWEKEGLPVEALRSAAEHFPPRKHRLNKVNELTGVEFWNDSKATNFAATLAAIDTFTKPVLWIGGGHSKQGDIAQFACSVAEKAQAAFLIGETAPFLAKAFVEQGKPANVFETLEEAVFASHKLAKPGDVVLFSPGFSSYDMFESYVQRGISFEKAVLSLKNHLVPH